ncbi:MAG TPA: DinB family protein [Pyrinomonadaceae bacterium]|nr:DinB family protein [Pyrinomonadaceae bacterium]
MNETTQNGDLTTLAGELEAVGRDARTLFGGLSAEQINWQPSPDAWSVGQCFEHLVKTNERFCSLLEEIGRGERKSGAWERLSPLSGFFGKMVLKAVGPESPRKFKAPRNLQPSASDVSERVIEQFAEHQQRFAGLMRAAGKFDATKVKVTSPVASFVTYNLLDACRIAVAHERRHFEQARRVTEAEGFPRATVAAV